MEKYSWKIIILVLLISFSACYQPSKKPDNLISKSKLKEILYDIHLYRNYSIAYPNTTRVEYYKIKEWVLEKHQVDIPSFDSTIAYYSVRPKKYKDLLQSIEKKIEKKEKQWEQEKK